MWSCSGQAWAVQTVLLHSVIYRDNVNWRVGLSTLNVSQHKRISVLQLSMVPVVHMLVRSGPNCVDVQKLNNFDRGHPVVYVLTILNIQLSNTTLLYTRRVRKVKIHHV
jgi:hypothetical protein